MEKTGETANAPQSPHWHRDHRVHRPPLTIKTVAIDQNGPAIPSEEPRKPWLRTRGVPQRLVECIDSGGRLTGQFSETEELTMIT